jgi:hypothetical protein
MPELLIPDKTEALRRPSVRLRHAATVQPRTEPLPFSRVVYCCAAINLVLHFIGRARYGLFRDELYSIACRRPKLPLIEIWRSLRYYE